MTNLAIRVEHLSKQYEIGAADTGYLTLRDQILQMGRGLLDFGKQKEEKRTIWALQDVSFDVNHGEVIGIIGRNGAGKSTLLKLLSQITEPTKGRILTYGRVGSLLEVGTGFHPELTGRENIYLNGAILGMSRAEIDRKFDEIVDFSGVEEFIDTPVKRYSSGMGLRLGFAVAAHMETEILIVDEVLAVGDAEFQKKCLGKMSGIANDGRTVLFVSHNMAAVLNLCNRAILLENGSVSLASDTTSVIESYIERTSVYKLSASLENVERSGGLLARFEEVAIFKSGTDGEIPRTGDDITIRVRGTSKEKVSSVVVCIVIWDSRGGRIIDANTGMKQTYVDLIPNKEFEIVFELKNVLLRAARYKLELWMGIENQQMLDYIPEALHFEVVSRLDVLKGNVDYPGSYRCEFEVAVEDKINIEVSQ